MALPAFSMRELIDAGVHFGHKTKRWNPRMAPFIYGTRNDVHIIDLQQTVPMLHRALGAVRSTALKNGRILFVGTKRQAADIIAEAATRCGQYYVNNRWLGGMLTNWQTIQNSIRQLRKIEETLAEGDSGLTKKERLTLQRQHDKLERSLGGIRDMGGKPDLLFVIDTNREEIAIKEAQTLGIPIVAIIDTNCTADGIDFPIPGNDDATRAIKLYCKLISDAALDGLGGREVDFASKKAKAPAEQAFLESKEAAEPEAEAKPQVKAEAAKPAPQDNRSARGGNKGRKEVKAAPAATTKKEAFAVEAKKAQAKKSDSDGGEATEAKASAKKAPAKKSA
jgi:small subunit ribosomal protein S2